VLRDSGEGEGEKVKIAMSKLVRECEVVPRGYGFAYYQPNSMVSVFYPWPLNHLMRLARDAWWRVRNAARDTALEEARYAGWLKGREETDRHIMEMFKLLSQKPDGPPGQDYSWWKGKE